MENHQRDPGRLAFLPRPVRSPLRWVYRQLREVAERLRPRRLRATWLWGGQVVAAIRARRQEPGLTVAVDIDPFWSALTGVGWYLYQLLEHLAERDDLKLRLYGQAMVPHVDDPPPPVAAPSGRAIEVVAYHVPVDLSFPQHWGIVLLRRLQSVLVAADANKVLFAPNYFLPPRFRLARGALVAMVHDLSVRRFAWTLEDTTRQALTRHLEKTVRRSRALLTHTETVRREIVDDGLGRPQEVYAISPGPGHLAQVEAGPMPMGVPSRFALHVGTLEPRKNLPTLIAAWRELRYRGNRPLTLVLCGDLGWKNHELRRQIAQGEEEGWLRNLGYVDDPTLAVLYHRARLVVCPSLYEGFGLPVVEALWAGSPVVCSDIPVFREVAGEAALFVPPQDVSGWTDSVAAVDQDETLRRDLARRGRRRVADLDWGKTAAATAAIWFRAMGPRCQELTKEEVEAG